MSPVPSAPVLVLLAAGRSTRYGTPKQLDAVGPGGATLMDYAIADAAAAGVKDVVVVVSSQNRRAIESHLAESSHTRRSVDVVEQDPGGLPDGAPAEARSAAVQEGRPLGTIQAVWSARDCLEGRSFLVANADDYYGPAAYRTLVAHLARGGASRGGTTSRGRWALAGYRLDETLSPHGGVNRGICDTDSAGRLLSIVEGLDLARRDGAITGRTPAGEPLRPLGSQIVSMNLWALTPDALDRLERSLEAFARSGGVEAGSEALLPDAVADAVREGVAEVTVLPVPGPYFGLTHPKDRPSVVEGLRRRGPPSTPRPIASSKE